MNGLHKMHNINDFLFYKSLNQSNTILHFTHYKNLGHIFPNHITTEKLNTDNYCK
jgi:hypothetical protein